MFSYGTGGLHTLPLHLVRFLWLPALNVCSFLGEWLQSGLHPILNPRFSLYCGFTVVLVTMQHQNLYFWGGVEGKNFNPEGFTDWLKS